MKLILKLALKDLFFDKFFLVIFVMTFSFGLLGFSFYESFKESAHRYLTNKNKEILTADLSISSRRMLTDDEKSKIQKLLPHVASYESIEMYSMLSFQNKTKLVELKTLPPNFPFYGKLNFKHRSSIDHQSIYVSRELLDQLGLKLNEKVKLGELELLVKDQIDQDTSQSFFSFNLGPRVYITEDVLKRSSLFTFGSTYRYGIYFKIPDDKKLSEIKLVLSKMLVDQSLTIKTYKESQDQLEQTIKQFNYYLGLISIINLILASIGLQYIYRLFLLKRFKTLGVLSSLGISKKQIAWICMIQVFILGIAAFILTILIDLPLLPLLDQLFFNQDQILKIYFSDLFKASLRIFLLIFPILFVILLPIFKDLFKLEIKELFQGRYSLNQKRQNWLYYLPAIFVLLGLSIWQSQSFKVGGIFFSVLVLSCLFIILFYRLVLISLTKFFNRFSYIFRHSFLYLNKNFISTGSFVLSLSLGTLLILLIPILKDTLQDEIHSDQTKVPGLFLFDIQPDQLDSLETLLLKDNLKLTFKSPLIRGRLLKINNQIHQIKKSSSWFKTQEDDQRERFQARVLNFSTRKTFSDTETIVSGKPFSGSFDWNKDELAEVSLEVRFADRYGIKLNDKLTFDIQGLEVNAIVTSLRSVKWTSFQPNFFILFQPGVLEDAPQTYLASIPTLSPERVVLVQKSIVDDFPNISILNVHELVKKTLDFTIKISHGIQLMAGLTILIGFFILYILGQSAFYERLYSLSLLRVVGMRKSSLLKMIFFEFSFLAVFAVSLGGILAILISMLLSYFLFDRMPVIPFQTVFEIYCLVLILSYLVTFLSFFGFFKIKPIILLREQVSQN